MPAKKLIVGLGTPLAMFWKSVILPDRVTAAASAVSSVGVLRHDQSASPLSMKALPSFTHAWVTAVGVVKPSLIEVLASATAGGASGVPLELPPPQAATRARPRAGVRKAKRMENLQQAGRKMVSRL